MVQQEQLDRFIRAFCARIEQQNFIGVSRVRVMEKDQYVVGKIEEEIGGEAIELWSENNEFTIVYSQSHWHIYEDGNTRQFGQLVQQVEQDVLAIIQGELLTYSAWQGERPLGGGCNRGTVEDAIQWGITSFKDATTIYVKQWNKALIKIEANSGDFSGMDDLIAE